MHSRSTLPATALDILQARPSFGPARMQHAILYWSRHDYIPGIIRMDTMCFSRWVKTKKLWHIYMLEAVPLFIVGINWSHYLDQCCNVVDWTRRTKLFIYIYIHIDKYEKLLMQYILFIFRYYIYKLKCIVTSTLCLFVIRSYPFGFICALYFKSIFLYLNRYVNTVNAYHFSILAISNKVNSRQLWLVLCMNIRHSHQLL